MKTWGTYEIRALGNCLMICVLLMPAIISAQTVNYAGTDLGSPAYSYYLTEGIMTSYQRQFQIQDTFQRKPISNNLKPQNVYERTLWIMEEFDTLFPGVITQPERDTAYAVDAAKASPTEISWVLGLIKAELERQGAWQEYTGLHTSKTPTDVYQHMRKLGWCHRQIAAQRGIKTTWDSVDRVYETVVYEFLPTVYAIADEKGIDYESYPFPQQPSKGVKPRNIYELVQALYANIMRYYAFQEANVNIVEFVDVNDCDEITPADVFDLEQIVAAELKLKNPELRASEQVANTFTTWRASQTALVPGHTFRLLQHLFLLTETILAQGE